jgi:hypothetical protein
MRQQLMERDRRFVWRNRGEHARECVVEAKLAELDQLGGHHAGHGLGDGVDIDLRGGWRDAIVAQGSELAHGKLSAAVGDRDDHGHGARLELRKCSLEALVERCVHGGPQRLVRALAPAAFAITRCTTDRHSERDHSSYPPPRRASSADAHLSFSADRARAVRANGRSERSSCAAVAAACTRLCARQALKRSTASSDRACARDAARPLCGGVGAGLRCRRRPQRL